MTAVIEGITRRGMWRPDPPLHILQREGNDMKTWCTGSPAEELNTMRRRRCPRCTALIREGVAEGMYGQEELADWLRSTRPARTIQIN